MRFQLTVDPGAEECVCATVHAPSDFTEQLEAMVRRYDAADRIAAFTQDETVLLPFSQIECITVIGGKTCAVDSHGKQYRLNHRLYELEQLLPPFFVRINKSALANETRLDRFCATFSGGVDAVFQCGYREYVSRRCFAQLKRRFSIK